MSITEYPKSAPISRLESLPAEILRKILIFVAIPEGASHSSTQLSKLQAPSLVNQAIWSLATSLPCLLTSRTLYTASLSVTYREITTSSSFTFNKLLNQLYRFPRLGFYVRSLDLSIHSDTGLPKLSHSITELLHLAPLLRHFRARPGFHDFLDQSALRFLLCESDFIETIDLSECNSPQLQWDLMTLCSDPAFRPASSITSLSLRSFSELPPEIFQCILSKLPGIRVLDVENTEISIAALQSIPTSARLTHLNLNHCSSLPGAELARLLTTHPAIAHSLVALEAEGTADARGLSEEDVGIVLAKAPKSLTSLNLKNSNMSAKHLPQLRTLCTQLEELTVGFYLQHHDLETLFYASKDLEKFDEINNTSEDVALKHHTVLDPLEEAVAVCKVRRRLSFISDKTCVSTLRYLNISSMSSVEQGKLKSSVLLGTNLEAIEISEMALRRYGIKGRVCRAVGWDVEWEGRRCWLRRTS